MLITAKCECGHEFTVVPSNFGIWAGECDCCGYTYHLEIGCPACYKIVVLLKTMGEE